MHWRTIQTVVFERQLLYVLATLLQSFHVEECGEKNYKELLEQYPKVTRVYLTLEPTCQAVIKDICHRMGVGMAEFIEKEVVTVEDYDLYCHYVAGVMRSASYVQVRA